MQKYEGTARLLRYNSHLCHVSNINAAFQSNRCPTCNTFVTWVPIIERHLTKCSERVKKIYPTDVYRIRGTLFDQLDSFGIKYMSDQKRLEELAFFHFELVFVQHDTFRDANTTTWIKKFVPISISIPSNLVTEPNFLLWFFHQLWSSSPRCNVYWNSWTFSFPRQNKIEELLFLISRQQKW